MNAIEPRARVRSVEAIEADIESQRKLVSVVLSLACDYMNVDTRPLVIIGDSVERIGDVPIPQDLRDLLAAEQTTLARLQYELYESVQAARH